MKTRTLPLAGLIVLVVLATLTPLPLRAGQSDTRFTFKEEIFVGPGETQDNIVSIGGTVTVEGTVRKAVFASSSNQRPSSKRTSSSWAEN